MVSLTLIIINKKYIQTINFDLMKFIAMLNVQSKSNHLFVWT